MLHLSETDFLIAGLLSEVANPSESANPDFIIYPVAYAPNEGILYDSNLALFDQI